MSYAELDRLKKLLHDNGFEYELSVADGHALYVSVSVETENLELPDALKPYAWDDVERAIWKGNAEKRSFNGANFELALRGYANAHFRKMPEVKALEATVVGIKTAEGFKRYEAELQRLWNEMMDPQIEAWENQLKEML